MIVVPCGIVYVLLLFLPTLPIIESNKDLAGGLIPAAGTIFAAVIAWTALTLRDAYESRDRKADYPAIDGLKQMQLTGALDVSNFPPAGEELYAWDLNINLTTLRTW